MTVAVSRSWGLTTRDHVIGCLLAAGAIAVVLVRFGLFGERPILMLGLVLFAPLSVMLSLIDMRIRRLPDALVLPGLIGFAALLVLEGLRDGSASVVLRGLLGALIPFLIFWVVAILWRGAIGGGDIKFVALTGGVSAWVSVEVAVLALCVAFLAGGVSALALLSMRSSARGSTLAFGPFLALGVWAALVMSGRLG